MYFIQSNLPLLLIALPALVAPWLFGGMMAESLLEVMPWCLMLQVEAMVFFPQRHRYETTAEARGRTWWDLLHDPFVRTGAVFLAILAIPFFNVALCPQCDAEAIANGLRNSPTVRFLPFCLNRGEHLNVFLWFLSAILTAAAVRHALVKRGKRQFVELMVWNGVALAVLGFVQLVTGAKGPYWLSLPSGEEVYFFSAFGYPNSAGAYFTALFALSVAVWRRRVVEVDDEIGRKDDANRQSPTRRLLRRHYMMIPSVICFAAAFATLSRAAILASSALAAVLAAHAFLVYMARRSRAQRVRALAGGGFLIVSVAVLSSMYMPRGVQKEIDSIETGQVLDRVSGRDGEYHGEVSRAIFLEHPVWGCGGWGYRHLAFAKTRPADLPRRGGDVHTGAANVHNDYMQFLVEHGSAGMLMIAMLFVMLLRPAFRTWRVLANQQRFSTKKTHLPPPASFFVFPPSAFCVLVGALATLIHAFGDCPLRSSAVLTLLFAELAALEGYLPRVDFSVLEKEDRHHHGSHRHAARK